MSSPLCPECGDGLLYIEDDPRFTEEDEGCYLIICTDCDWAGRLVMKSYLAAVKRLEEMRDE